MQKHFSLLSVVSPEHTIMDTFSSVLFCIDHFVGFTISNDCIRMGNTTAPTIGDIQHKSNHFNLVVPFLPHSETFIAEFCSTFGSVETFAFENE